MCVSTSSSGFYRYDRLVLRYVLLLLSIFLFLLPTPALHAVEAGKQDKKLVLLVRELRNEEGDLVPIREEIRQLLNYFERELRIRFEIRRYPWIRLLNNAKNGEGIVFGLSRNRERLATFRFSETIYANYVWLVTRSDASFVFNSMQDLKGKTVGVVRGASYGDEFDSMRNVLFLVEEDVSSHGARLKKLLNKRMDVMVFGDRRSQPEEVKQLLINMLSNETSHMETAIEQSFKVLPKPLLVDDLHFAAVSPQYDEWIQKLNLAILAGRKSGEINRLLLRDK
ncbi:transporter substrate-binding domain-containing protein [Undibacterium sp. CY18W]|uniref:Transporter substrate-binding domain-containing protein n=1 Tax=Undibacterium hunanense TaxID=2762292 RepID=A0ABR6ZY10_9BURK|nr:transporter substrate-binding domain-containing protein [Undibacterium hunanense]MBC3920766.1 transporter substrate-binding domain-containing protein [Undibacterium hunanense]